MKKTLILAALAVCVLFVFAGSAFAAGGYDYKAWSAAAPNDTVPTPHKGYATTTVKCAVCHSVHNASPGDNIKYGFNPLIKAYDGTTEMLLQSSVADACTYCHISPGISTKIVYGATEANYTTDSVYGHNAAHAPCAGCHAVHGANTLNLDSVTTFILKGGDEQLAASGAVMPADWGTDADDADGQISFFCTNCHKYYSDASETQISFTGWNGDTYTEGAQLRKHHPMKAASAAFDALGATQTGMTVAWKGSENCISCHDAEVSGTSYDFPHYTSGAARFLLGSADAATTGSAIGANPSVDGACIKCHVESAAGSGVGKTF